jgi:hypothetical protein
MTIEAGTDSLPMLDVDSGGQAFVCGSLHGVKEMGCRDECAGEARSAELATRFILLAKSQLSLPSIRYAEVKLEKRGTRTRTSLGSD